MFTFKKAGFFYLTVFIYCLSFIILSVTFIFSNLKEFLDVNKRRKLVICLFLMPIAVIIYLLLHFSTSSTFWLRKMQILLNPRKIYNEDKSKANFYFYLYIFYANNWESFMNLIPLYIMEILSVVSDKEPEEKHGIDMEYIVNF